MHCPNAGGGGPKVACIDINAESLAETVGAIRAAGGTAEPLACDVTQSERVGEVVDQVIEMWGKLDILVNNAGVTRDNVLVRMKDEQWDLVININLRGTFLFTRAAARPMMKARGGPDHQRCQRFGADGQSGPGELLGLEGRRDRADPNGGLRTGQPEHHGQRRRAGLHRHRHDGQIGGGDPPRGSQADSVGPVGRAPGRGRRGACSWPAMRRRSSPATF